MRSGEPLRICGIEMIEILIVFDFPPLGGSHQHAACKKISRPHFGQHLWTYWRTTSSCGDSKANVKEGEDLRLQLWKTRSMTFFISARFCAIQNAARDLSTGTNSLRISNAAISDEYQHNTDSRISKMPA